MNQRYDVLLAAWLLASLLSPGSLSAAPDDEDDAPGAAEAAADPFAAQVIVRNFDEDWIFQSTGGEQGAHDRLAAQLKLRLDYLLRTCQLTSAQQAKLRLAAAVDDSRFFTDVEVLRQRFKKVKDDQEGLQVLWSEVALLQQRLATGPYNDKSFFGKLLHSMLSAEQDKTHRELAAQRALFQYRAGLEAVLTGFDDEIGLTDEQHAALIKLALDETSPPESGVYDTANILAQLGKLPPKKLQSLLSDRQWQRLSLRLAPAVQLAPAGQFIPVQQVVPALPAVQEIRIEEDPFK